MVKENQFGDPSRETKWVEFCNKVSSREFDDVIKARVTHLFDQMTEDVMQHSPVEGFIESDNFGEEMEESGREGDVEFGKELPKEGEAMVVLREEFMKDPKNFEDYLAGKL